MVAQQLAASPSAGACAEAACYVGDCRSALRLFESSPQLRHGRRSASGYARDMDATRKPIAVARWAKTHQADGEGHVDPDVALNALADQHASLVAKAASPREVVARVASSAFVAAAALRMRVAREDTHGVWR